MLFAAIVLLVVTGSVAAADIAAGKKKALTCVGCHGPKGISTNPEWPNLAGQKDVYLAKQIKAFKTGVRKSPQMTPMVQILNDADIANIAAYYSSLKCQ